MATLSLARQGLRKEIQDASLNAAKAFHAAKQAEQTLGYATQLAKLHRQVDPSSRDAAAFKAAVQARMEAEIAAIKAELDFRTAVVDLLSMTGRMQ